MPLSALDSPRAAQGHLESVLPKRGYARQQSSSPLALPFFSSGTGSHKMMGQSQTFCSSVFVAIINNVSLLLLL